VEAGAAAVQVFDSWIGSLSLDHYRRHVLPAVQRLFDGLAELAVPRIYFGVGTSHLLESIGRSGADVVGVDWRVSLDQARARLPAGVALQGNLDPVVCLAPRAVVEAEVSAVLERAPERGYVFNLGHGVLPETDPGVMALIVELVHAHSSTDPISDRTVRAPEREQHPGGATTATATGGPPDAAEAAR
jgi:uroporphyrinogen decarboxylase